MDTASRLLTSNSFSSDDDNEQTELFGEREEASDSKRREEPGGRERKFCVGERPNQTLVIMTFCAVSLTTMITAIYMLNGH